MLEMSSQTAPASRHLGASALGYNLAGIAVLVLLLAVGMAYVIDDLGRANKNPQPSLSDGDPILQTISGRELAIPAAWFRYGEQVRNGFTNQIDLRLTLPADDGVTTMPVDVTLLPRSRAGASSSLLDGVYLHQFGDETLNGVPGLVGKPMLASNGYAGESVWYDALSPNPFVAKCVEPVTPDTPAQCVRTAYLPSGIAAVYTFDAALLTSWRSFDTEMERWLSHIGAW